MICTKWLAAALAVATLAGCSPKSEEASESSYAENYKISADLQHVDAPAPTEDGLPPPQQTAPVGLPQLAYDYSFGFVLPQASTETLARRHQAACEKAGPQQCQLLSANTASDPDAGRTNIRIEMRVAPQWLKTFQSGLGADLKNARGRISEQSVTSEDLSLQIVDSEARLNNKLALRDRLQTIIRQSPGKIAELIEAETQLSQVQADIDALSSSLAVMKKRVATSGLTLNYTSDSVAATSSSFAPVTRALKNVVSNMMYTLGFMIDLISSLLPLLIIGSGLIWYGLKLWKKRKAKKATTKTPTP